MVKYARSYLAAKTDPGAPRELVLWRLALTMLRQASDFLADGASKGPPYVAEAGIYMERARKLFEDDTAVWTDGCVAYIAYDCGADVGMMDAVVGTAASYADGALSALRNGRKNSIVAFHLIEAERHLGAALDAESGDRFFYRV